MLRISLQSAEELLARCLDEGDSLLERAGLVGDDRDYETWKVARKKWIELTEEALGRIYDGSAEAREFRGAVSVLTGGGPWQTEYAEDLEYTRAALDALTSLRNQLGVHKEPTDGPEHAKERSAGSDPWEEPIDGSERAGSNASGFKGEEVRERSAGPDPWEEPTDGSEHARERSAGSEPALDPAPTLDPAPAPDPAPALEPAPAPAATPGQEPVQERFLDSAATPAPVVGAELAPSRSAGAVLAQEPSDGAGFMRQSANGGLSTPSTKQVFLIHGRNEKWKQAVARLLEHAGQHELTILCERPNDRRTLEGQFEQQAAGLRYAVVLLTADDVGAPRLDSDREPYFSTRACQGVVFAMGFLVAALTPRCVCVLYEDGVELPCDLDGIAYVRLDPAGTWQSKLLLQLRGAGFDYDLNRLAPV
jgi:predicted nucleotide-binding protein